MKESEFYQRALADADYRKAKLEELRYHKNVCAVLMWACLASAVSFSLYSGFTEGRWLLGDQLLFSAVVVAGPYSVCKTRIAALEVFNAPKPNQSI